MEQTVAPYEDGTDGDLTTTDDENDAEGEEEMAEEAT